MQEYARTFHGREQAAMEAMFSCLRPGYGTVLSSVKVSIIGES